MPSAIEFREVCFAPAPSPESQGRLLLDRISLCVEEGTTTAILGRSGSGKTTLLRTVNRMIEPTSGDVLVRGQSNRVADLTVLRRSIGYVIQEAGLFPHFSVERNVGLALEIGRAPAEQRKARSRELLSAVGLDPKTYAGRFPHQLSGGQRQRVGLARALAVTPQSGPAILLMDEPFGALDPMTRAEMQDMLRDLKQRLSMTVLLVTHDLDEALYLADGIVLLGEGKLIANLPPHQFLASTLPETQSYVRAFHRGEQAAEAGQRP